MHNTAARQQRGARGAAGFSEFAAVKVAAKLETDGVFPTAPNHESAGLKNVPIVVFRDKQ